MSQTITKNADGSVTISIKSYNLTETLKEIFPINYTKDTEASYQSRIEMVSDLVDYCANLISKKE